MVVVVVISSLTTLKISPMLSLLFSWSSSTSVLAQPEEQLNFIALSPGRFALIRFN